MSELDINTKWNALKKQLNDIMDSCIPNKMTTTRHNVPWTNRTLIRLTRKKQRLFNKAQKKKGNEAWSRYKSCKKQVTQQMRKARSDYVNNIIESAFQEVDTKPFWKFIRSKRGENIGVAPLKSQGKLFADGRSKAKILNNQFKPSLLRRSPLTYLHHMDPTFLLSATSKWTSTASRSSLVTPKRTKPPDQTTSPAISWKKLPLNWPRFWPTSSNTHYEMAYPPWRLEESTSVPCLQKRKHQQCWELSPHFAHLCQLQTFGAHHLSPYPLSSGQAQHTIVPATWLQIPPLLWVPTPQRVTWESPTMRRNK